MDIQKLSDTIGLIYEVPLNASKWMEVQEKLATYSNTIANHILVFGKDMNVTASTMYSEWGDEVANEANKEYNEFYYKFDTGKPILYAKKMAGQVITNSEITSDFEKRTCPLHNEFNKKFQCEQQLIMGANAGDSFVSIVSTRPNGDDFEQQDKDIFGILSSHIIKAVQQSSKLESLFGNQFSYQRVLHDKYSATVIVDCQHNVLWMNSTAETLLCKSGDLSYKSSKLSVNDSSLRDKLTNSIAQATSNSEQDREKCHLHKVVQDGQALAMAVFSSSRKTLFATDKQRVATIVIKIPKALNEYDLKKLKVVFDLSPAEAKLALAVANGVKLQEYSELNHRSMNTIRSTLKRIMSKTGCNSQHQLVSLVHQYS